MAQTASQPLLSVAEYLRGEQLSELRHEYVAGQVYAMAGASDVHGLLAGNLFAALRPHLRGGPCQLFVADMKVRLQVAGEDIFYYPDLVLSCDSEDRERYWRSRPCLLVEVLSEASERIDRREKFLAYTTLPSLQEYLLIAQDRQEVTIYRRCADWHGEVLRQGELRLDCLGGLSLPLAVIYEEVVFPG
ncbi:Uma2 family endonuclease [Acidithiobacillus sp.]